MTNRRFEGRLSASLLIAILATALLPAHSTAGESDNGAEAASAAATDQDEAMIFGALGGETVAPGGALAPQAPCEAFPSPGAMISTGGMLLRVAIGMALVMGILGAVLFLYRKATRGRPGPGSETAIRLLSQRSLGSRTTLSVVQVSGETLLLGITPQQVNTLARIASSPVQGPSAPAGIRGASPAASLPGEPESFGAGPGGADAAGEDAAAVAALLRNAPDTGGGFEQALAGEVRRVRENLWSSLKRLEV